MSFPEACPFCGAERLGVKDGSWVTFACFTSIHTGYDTRRTQSSTCEGLERTRLLARVAELEARCKRLEEAGDFMAYNENVDFKTLVAAWTKAKEAKP